MATPDQPEQAVPSVATTAGSIECCRRPAPHLESRFTGRASIRLGAAQSVLLSRRAINTVCEASGASAHADTSPLQRIQRYVETLEGHVVFDWDRTAELFGRVRLGMKLRPGDLL